MSHGKSRCCCGKAECEDAYRAILEKAPTNHPWKKAPVRIRLEVDKATAQTWLFLLGVCHHISPVKDLLDKGMTNLRVYRHHFPRALLDHRKTYGADRFAAFLTKAAVERIAQMDSIQTCHFTILLHRTGFLRI